MEHSNPYNITKYFLHRPVTSFMVMLSFIILGAYSLPFLRLGLLPNTTPPGVSIITRYPGVAPGKIENLITKTIEEKVSEIANISQIFSVSKEGESKINLVFEHSVDLKYRIADVEEKIDLIRKNFPREVEAPYIVPYDPTDKPVFILSITSSKYDLKLLREYADKKLKNLFNRIEGVSEIFIGGGFIREIQILPDPLKLISFNISLNDIMSLVQSRNIFLPAGILKDKNRGERFIATKAKFQSIDEIRNLLIPYGKDKSISLKNIASVKDHFRERENISKTNGQDRVSIYIQKTGTGNTLHISRECRKIIHAIKLPGIKLEVDFDQGKYIQKAIDRLTSAIVFGGLIVMLVLWLFLRKITITFVIALSIPASIISTFFALYLLNIELNVMTLSGLALGAGMLIDNSIVVSEKIEMIQKENESFENSVLNAVQSVQAEITASTLTTLIVFIPLLFVEESTRLLYKNLAISISISLLMSLFISLTIIPTFIYHLGKYDSFLSEKFQKFFKKLRIVPIKKIPQKIKLFSILKSKLNPLRLLRYYLLLIQFGERNFKKILACFMIFLFAGYFFFQIAKKEYLDPMDSGEISATVELETGTNLESTEEVIKSIESLVRSHPAVLKVNSKIEKWHATLMIKMKEEHKFKLSTEDFIKELKLKTNSVKSAFVYYSQEGENSQSKELDIDIYGDKYSKLKEIAKDIAGKLKSAILGVDEVVLRFRKGKPAIEFEPKITELSRIGFNPSMLGNILRSSIYGAVITKFYDKDKEVDVRLKVSPDFMNTPEKLKNMYIPGGVEGFVPILSVSKTRESIEDTKIYRKNKKRMVTITVKFKGIDTNRAGNLIQEMLANYHFDKNYYFKLGDSYQRQLQNQTQMLLVSLTAILLIYLLLGALFESFQLPLLIILTVPGALIFSLLLIVLLGKSLNLSVYIGFILTSGIVVNNAILVVSNIKDKISKMPSRKNIYRAGLERLRPILMTSITTLFGMTPLLFDYKEGSNLWRPLAFTISTGLLFSILISLYLVPLIYLWIYNKKPDPDY